MYLRDTSEETGGVSDGTDPECWVECDSVRGTIGSWEFGVANAEGSGDLRCLERQFGLVKAAHLRVHLTACTPPDDDGHFVGQER